MACTRRKELEMIKRFTSVVRTRGATEADPIELIRAHCFINGITGLKQLTKHFNKADKDGNGLLDYKEFNRVLIRAGIHIEERQLKKVFETLDLNQDGFLSIEEALGAMRPPISRHRKELISQAFRKLDRDHSGKVTPEDLRGVYDTRKHPKYLNGEWTEDRVLREFLKTFDAGDKDGMITEEEFTDYYLALSLSTESDAAFDLIMRQAWGL